MTQKEWIILGDTGVSSRTMWAAVNGVVNEPTRRKVGIFDIPYDVYDFSRCYKYYVECELNGCDLEIVKRTFPMWTPFVDNWDTLVDLYKKGRGKALYDMLEKCREYEGC